LSRGTSHNGKWIIEYAPDDLSARERHKVLTGFVLPRPIAWVTTIGPPAWSMPRRSASSPLRTLRLTCVKVSTATLCEVCCGQSPHVSSRSFVSSGQHRSGFNPGTRIMAPQFG
jgi:hypothetical protein